MMQYICTKRYKKKGMDGQYRNIPWGTKCETAGETILLDGKPLCYRTSQDAYDYFSRDDDGYGELRGKLVQDILRTLGQTDEQHQERWDRIWEAKELERFRRADHEDHWLWNYEFYNASILDLKHILHVAKGA